MNNDFIDKLAIAYFYAKNYVISKGFANEIDSFNDICFEKINEKDFIREAAWVILSSGMSYYVISKKFPSISNSFFEWESANKIVKNKTKCIKSALMVFNNPQKINAIMTIAEKVNIDGFPHIKKNISHHGISYLREFPFIGPATSFHLAKNIGFNFAKPDRHLLRISNITGYQSPNDLCNDISNRICEKASTIDLVLWRYATIDRNYISKINHYISA